jgi:hypothetical protein
MFNAKKLIQLNEQFVADKGPVEGQRAARREIHEQLGITYCPRTGRQIYNASKAALDCNNVSLQEIGMEFSGCSNSVNFAKHITEGGGIVMPSNFSQINSFTDVMSGLLGAITLGGYQRAAIQLGGELMTSRFDPRQGGKDIDALMDGSVRYGNADLGFTGTPLPSSGEKQTFINYPAHKRFGRQIGINKYVWIFDQTSKIQTEAANIGYLTGYEVELEKMKTITGIDNTYNRLGTANNTYQVSAGAAPFTYINSVQKPFITYQSVRDANLMLQHNVDPTTGLEISVDTPTILVGLDNEMAARTVLEATGIHSYSVAGTTNFPAIRTDSPNPLRGYNLKVFNAVWYNNLVRAANLGGGALSTTNAAGRWYMGDFMKAFSWRYALPFTSWAPPLAEVAASQGTTYVHMCEEAGVACVTAPEYVARLSVEAL